MASSWVIQARRGLFIEDIFEIQFENHKLIIKKPFSLHYGAIKIWHTINPIEPKFCGSIYNFLNSKARHSCDQAIEKKHYLKN